MEQAAPLTIFQITRTHHRLSGFFGILDHDGEPFALTIEHPNLFIPAGEYLCKKSIYHKGGYPTYEITGIPNRTDCKFHKANIALPGVEEDVVGCVGVAEQFGLLKGRTAILDSAAGFQEFMARTKSAESFKLVIQ